MEGSFAGRFDTGNHGAGFGAVEVVDRKPGGAVWERDVARVWGGRSRWPSEIAWPVAAFPDFAVVTGKSTLPRVSRNLAAFPDS